MDTHLPLAFNCEADNSSQCCGFRMDQYREVIAIGTWVSLEGTPVLLNPVLCGIPPGHTAQLRAGKL